MFKEFAAVLTQYRREAGYSSGYAFYHQNGGAKVFSFGYSHYKNFEQGRSLPRPQGFGALARLLLLTQEETKLRQFLLVYLRSAWGEEMFRFFIAPYFREPRSQHQRHPLGAAIKKIWEIKNIPLSQKQSQALADSYGAYWTFLALSYDQKAWPAGELTRVLGLTKSECQKALKCLLNLKLLRQDKEGAYYCPHAGAIYVHPRLNNQPHLPPHQEKLSAYWDRMEKERGGLIYRRTYSLRASEGELLNYLPYLTQAIHGIGIYSTLEPASDSALFVVEGLVRKMCPL